MAVIPDTHNTGLTPTQIDTAFSNALTHTPSSSTPVMDGTGAAGTADTFARGDHVHPHDTTKQDTVLGSWTPDTSATHQTPAGTDTVLEALQKIDRNQRADETNISSLADDIGLRSFKKVFSRLSASSTTYNYTMASNDFGTNVGAGTYIISIVPWATTATHSLYMVSFTGANPDQYHCINKIAGDDASISLTANSADITVTSSGRVLIFALS